MTSLKSHLSWRYLAAEAGLFLLLNYLVLIGGTFNGVILFEFNQINFILIFVLGCAWLVWRFWRARPFPATFLDKPLLALAAACVLVTVFSVDPRRSAITLVQLLFYILLFYCLVDLLRAGLDADLLIKIWLLSSLVVMIFSLLQIAFWYKSWIDLAGWRHLIPSTTIRISAFLGHPNFMAAYLNLLLPLGIIQVFQSRGRAGKVGWSIWALMVTGLIFFTSSRGGWFGTGAALGILAILWAGSKWLVLKNRLIKLPQRKGLASLLIIVLAGMGVAGYFLLKWQSKNATHASSGLDFMSRAYIWQVAWHTFLAHPLLGNGPFTFGTQFIKYISVPTGLLLAHAHNFLFNVAAEAGAVGVAAFGWVIIAFLFLAWKNWKTADSKNRLVLMGLFTSMGGLVVHSLFDTPELLPLIGIMIVNFTVLVITRGSDQPGTMGNQPGQSVVGNIRRINSRAGRAIILSAAWLILVILFGWAVWAYQPAAQGVAAANSNDWASAAKGFELAAARDPRMAFNWFQAGFARGELALRPDGSLKDGDQLSLAISDYQRGVGLEPVYATNWANLGLLEWARGNHDMALEDMKKAAATAPEQHAFLLTYGRMLELVGQAGQAKDIYRQELDSFPSWANTYFFRATPLRLDVVKNWKVETNQPDNNPVVGASPTTIELAGFGLTDSETIAKNQLTLGESLTREGDLNGAVAAFKSGLALFDQTTSFGVGQLGNSQYGWYIFDRQSIDADILPGLDYPVFTDGVVQAMLDLADDDQKLGNAPESRQVFEKIIQVAPDCQPAREKLK